MEFKRGDLLPLMTGKLTKVEEVLPQGKYKVILPDVVEIGPSNYTTNVAIVKPVVKYVIESYE